MRVFWKLCRHGNLKRDCLTCVVGEGVCHAHAYVKLEHEGEFRFCPMCRALMFADAAETRFKATQLIV